MIGDAVSGLSCDMITDYVKYLGNLRCKNLGLAPIYEGHEKRAGEYGMGQSVFQRKYDQNRFL